jgi:hypothetical protein
VLLFRPRISDLAQMGHEPARQDSESAVVEPLQDERRESGSRTCSGKTGRLVVARNP